jgi:hypothetical protein
MVFRVGYLPFGIAGVTLCKGIILVRKDAPGSLIAHERVHESEWTPLWLIRYLLSPVFRMKAEVRAYTVQAYLEGVSVTNYYTTIRDFYWLNTRAKKQLSALLLG